MRRFAAVAIAVGLVLIACAKPAEAGTATGPLGELSTAARLATVDGERRLLIDARGVISDLASPGGSGGSAAALTGWSDGKTAEPCPGDAAPVEADDDVRPVAWDVGGVLDLERGDFASSVEQRVDTGLVARRICTYLVATPDSALAGAVLASRDVVRAPAEPLPRCGLLTARTLLDDTIPTIDGRWSSYDLEAGELAVDHVRCVQLIRGGRPEMAVAYRWTRIVSCLAAHPWVIYRSSASGWRVSFVRIKRGAWGTTGRPLHVSRGGLVEYSPWYASPDQAFCGPSGLHRRLIRWGGTSWVVRRIG